MVPAVSVLTRRQGAGASQVIRVRFPLCHPKACPATVHYSLLSQPDRAVLTSCRPSTAFTGTQPCSAVRSAQRQVVLPGSQVPSAPPAGRTAARCSSSRQPGPSTRSAYGSSMSLGREVATATAKQPAALAAFRPLTAGQGLKWGRRLGGRDGAVQAAAAASCGVELTATGLVPFSCTHSTAVLPKAPCPGLQWPALPTCILNHQRPCCVGAAQAAQRLKIHVRGRLATRNILGAHHLHGYTQGYGRRAGRQRFGCSSATSSRAGLLCIIGSSSRGEGNGRALRGRGGRWLLKGASSSTDRSSSTTSVRLSNTRPAGRSTCGSGNRGATS